MIIRKITSGFVTQNFDTEKGRFISQEFTAGDDCVYEDEKGEGCAGMFHVLPPEKQYLPFTMVQPELPRARCPNCKTEGEEGAGCPNCPGFWYDFSTVV